MEGISVDLNVKIWTIAFTLFNTAVLFWIMKKLLFQPVHDFMENRKSRIVSDIENAHSLKKEAENSLLEYKNKLSMIADEKHRIISEGRKKGEELFEMMKKEAEEEKQRILRNAENEKSLMMKHAREELRKEVAVLSLNIAEGLIKKEVDEKIHEKLINEALDDISDIKSM